MEIETTKKERFMKPVEAGKTLSEKYRFLLFEVRNAMEYEQRG